MTDHDMAVLLWFMWHGGIAFLAVLLVTAVLEHFWPEDWSE